MMYRVPTYVNSTLTFPNTPPHTNSNTFGF